MQLLADYDLNMGELYMMVAKSVIEWNDALAILSSAGLSSPSTDFQLPSWVPDWTKTDRTTVLSILRYYLAFSASAGQSGGHHMFINDGAIPNVLGIIVDTVIVTQYPCIERKKLKTALKDWTTSVEERGVPLETFLLALVAGTNSGAGTLKFYNCLQAFLDERRALTL